jgi:hypothetical protein
MYEQFQDVSTDVARLQMLPESEPAPHGAHITPSCRITCPVFTSDSIPSICCHN